MFRIYLQVRFHLLLNSFRLIHVIFGLVVLSFGLRADEWHDLKEGERDYYGSEKSEKFPVSNLFWEIEDWSGHKSTKILWLFKTKDYPKYSSTRFFPLYYNLNSKIDNRQKFRFLNYTFRRQQQEVDRSVWPLIFWGSNPRKSTSYHSVMPFYYYHNRDGQKKESSLFFLPFPFYSYHKQYNIQQDESHHERVHVSLLHYRSYAQDNGGNEFSHYSSWGFPVLPFLFYSHENPAEGSYRRLLTLIHWQKDVDGWQAASFLPFFSYHKNRYWSIPIAFFYKDLHEKPSDYGNTFFPLLLYYHNWHPTQETFLWGPYYSNQEKIHQESFRSFFPFFWMSRKKDRDWTLIFPLYLDYNDRENDYHINLIWFSRSQSGLAPRLSPGQKQEKWYLDYDLTFFYYLFSLSFRDSFDKPYFLRSSLDTLSSFESQSQNKKSGSQLLEDEPDSPRLAKKRDVSRESSLSFRGYSALFGLISFEKADSRRHFRLLPFSWLTWDEESDDKIILFPPFPPLFVWYKSLDLEYNVIFPFYGRQKDKTSEMKVFLINTYISEQYEEDNRKETSIFWPLINFYSTNTNSGHRFLPFYIHQNQDNDQTTINYTLFSRYENRSSDKYDETSLFVWPALSYYEKNNYHSKAFFTPFLFWKNSSSRFRMNFLWLNDFTIHKTKSGNKLDYLLAFPFYYDDDFFMAFPFTFTGYNRSRFYTLTLFNYLQYRNRNDFYYNFLYIWEWEKNKNNRFSLLFRSFDHYFSENRMNISGLYGLAWNFRKNKEEWRDASLLWLGYENESYSKIYNFLPLIRLENADSYQSRIYGPLFLYTKESKQKVFHLGMLGLGYWYSSSKISREESLYVLLGALYREYTEEQRGYRTRGSLWGWLWEYQEEEETGYRKFSILKLFSYKRLPDGTRKLIGFPF